MQAPPKILLGSLLDTYSDPFMVIDEDYQVVAMNQACEQAFGVSAAQIVGRPCYEVSHGNSRPCFELGDDCPHHQIFETQQAHSCLHLHSGANGRDHRVRVKAFPLAGSNGKLYLGEVLQDLSAEKATRDKGISMVGTSPTFLAMMERLISAAQSDCPVLLEGETGTGKELAASFLHQHSRRSDGPFLTLDCTVLTEGLFESEVFGHERGAFTGSQGKKTGLFELAGGGTLFLDEVGELPAMIQSKLLRVLDTGEFRRVGGVQALHADVRVVCATNRDLAGEVKAGRFRKDLYYRIAGVSVRLPSMRERAEDIPLLAQALLERMNASRQRHQRLTPAALDWLGKQEFPGNVRELRNVVRAADAVSNRGVIDVPQLRKVATTNGLSRGEGRCEAGPDATIERPIEPAAPSATLAEFERRHITELLGRHGSNRREIAEVLGISVRTLYRKLKKYQLNG